MRKVQFINEEYYHVYNRGVDKREIFQDEKDYFKFLRNLRDFNNKSYYEQRIKALESKKELSSFLLGKEKVIDIVAYSLLPNHYHLIIRQLTDNGVSNFMHKIGTSYTNYFNTKNNRNGSLFQGPYKAIHIDDNNYLLWLSGYVNGNVEIHGIEKAEDYRWSSFNSFTGGKKNEILGNIDIVLSQFKTLEEYKKFVGEVIKESRSRKETIKKEKAKYLLE